MEDNINFVTQKLSIGKELFSFTFPDKYVVVDLETTGFSRTDDSIIEIGAILVDKGFIVDRFQQLVCPECSIDKRITDITGITNEMVCDCPNLKQTLLRFINFVEYYPLICHNKGFDQVFLRNAFINHLGISFDNEFIDSLEISRNLFPSLNNHALETLVGLFGISDSVEHRALSDAMQTFQCFEFFRHFVSLNNALYSGNNGKKKKKYDPYSHLRVDISKLDNSDIPIDQNNPFFGKRCVFTGVFHSFSRQGAAESVMKMGGIIQENVTMKTDFLIVGSFEGIDNVIDGKSGKLNTAEKYITKGLSIKIISEPEFELLLNENNESDDDG